jgi:hypothetical protein
METFDHGCYATLQRDNTEWWAYSWKCLTFGCLATTGVSNLRLPNNDGIRPKTSQYIWAGNKSWTCKEVYDAEASCKQFTRAEEDYFPVAVATPLYDGDDFILRGCPSMDFYSQTTGPVQYNKQCQTLIARYSTLHRHCYTALREGFMHHANFQFSCRYLPLETTSITRRFHMENYTLYADDTFITHFTVH